MNNTIVLAISGKIGSGKTTLEGLLREHFGNDHVESYAFADGLKESYCAIFAAARDDVYTIEGKTRLVPELGCTVGKFLQDYGNHGRQFNEKLWMFRIGRAIAQDKPRVAIITDCRFPNEAQYIKSIGGKVIRLERPADLIPVECAQGRDPMHTSETALDYYKDFDALFVNDSSKAELRDQVLSWLREVA